METKSQEQIIRDYLYDLYEESLASKSDSQTVYLLTPEGFEEFIETYNQHHKIEQALKLWELVEKEENNLFDVLSSTALKLPNTYEIQQTLKRLMEEAKK